MADTISVLSKTRLELRRPLMQAPSTITSLRHAITHRTNARCHLFEVGLGHLLGHCFLHFLRGLAANDCTNVILGWRQLIRHHRLLRLVLPK